MRSILAVLLENEPGALSRVVGLFAQRNYNIESLTVAPTEDSTLSRLTLTTSGDQQTITQIMKQLDKLVEVVRVVDLCEGDHVERELLLIKVRAEGAARAEINKAIINRAQDSQKSKQSKCTSYDLSGKNCNKKPYMHVWTLQSSLA